MSDVRHKCGVMSQLCEIICDCKKVETWFYASCDVL